MGNMEKINTLCIMLCVKCGHEQFHLRCPCERMIFFHEQDGKKYFKKACKQCDRLIFSKGCRGLTPRDYDYELCGNCQHQHIKSLVSSR